MTSNWCETFYSEERGTSSSEMLITSKLAMKCYNPKTTNRTLQNYKVYPTVKLLLQISSIHKGGVIFINIKITRHFIHILFWGLLTHINRRCLYNNSHRNNIHQNSFIETTVASLLFPCDWWNMLSKAWQNVGAKTFIT